MEDFQNQQFIEHQKNQYDQMADPSVSGDIYEMQEFKPCCWDYYQSHATLILGTAFALVFGIAYFNQKMAQEVQSALYSSW